jgi:hypothetical protein
MDIWLARNGRPPDSMNPVEKLCFIGTRGMGALEYEPALVSSSQSFIIEIRCCPGGRNSGLTLRQRSTGQWVIYSR